jgi:acylphosphatase
MERLTTMNVCKRVRYFGRVQGVGFRYTVNGLAKGYAVAGHVRNLADGSVELVAEGAADQVQGLLAAIHRRMAGYIERDTITDEAPTGFHSFHIRIHDHD